ncbi:MAG TPA: acyl-CoA dehydrogenase family protein [Rhizomicrobium sp.]|jgi:putative acyl-CoA dehydrogenase|nr:acyl-CoA dehydrogenase family protein [Rhizomicrobium sp.]
MSALRRRSQLGTHEVANQPPPFEDVNLFETDAALREGVSRAGAESHAERLHEFGAKTGSAEVMEWAARANEFVPRLRSFDRFGRRIDEVEFHPAYHRLMTLGLDAGVASAAWSPVPAGHVQHAALEFLMAQAEPGVCCPMTMTYASVAALRAQPEIAAQWLPRILAAKYDPSSQPAAAKEGVTVGMAMTEKQGGSDVRANTSRAEPTGETRPGREYLLNGHKWFCSAPMSDAFLTLAYTENGLSCFLVPRWRPDGTRNAIDIMRLKDKLGDRANASAEIEYRGAHAVMLGEEGRGVRTIIEMVQHTRLDCAIAPAAYMRQSLALASWHAAHRSAFQKKLIDQPLMRTLLADMAIESEAATALVFRVAKSFDEARAGPEAGAFSRIATPVAKYWLNKRVVNFVYEAMEVHGGAGYVEESVLPRIFRQSPLNSIWEGSGNVICLDVLRAMRREPESIDAFLNELETARGASRALDDGIARLRHRLSEPIAEADARRLVEQMALVLQGAVLVRNAPPAIAEGFCSTRFAENPGIAYGAPATKLDENTILSRAAPFV